MFDTSDMGRETAANLVTQTDEDRSAASEVTDSSCVIPSKSRIR